MLRAFFFCFFLIFIKVTGSLEAAFSPHSDTLISAYAVDGRTKEIQIADHADRPLLPASCMKIVTTGAAFYLLGPDMRFETTLEYDGSIDEKGTLHGNVYIRGGGDPCLGSDRIPSCLSWEKEIASWVLAIQNLGIKTIEGNVIADASRWEKAMAVPSWSWEDLGNYYGAGASALSFHENYYTLFFKPAEQIGLPAAILRLDPPLLTITLSNEVKTGPAGSGDRACIYGSEFSYFSCVRGTIPLGVDEFSIKGAIPDPAAACASFLINALKNNGISVALSMIESQENKTVFHTVHSPPLREIIHWTNRKSINLYAEHLLKKIGEKVLGEGSTAAGIQAVSDFWRSQDIDLSGFHMADGSGLSRKNLISAKQLVSILLKIKNSEFSSLFFQSMPQQNGERSANTGTMSLVNAIAGWEGDIVFAILINHAPKPEAEKKITEFFSEKKARSLEQGI